MIKIKKSKKISKKALVAIVATALLIAVCAFLLLSRVLNDSINPPNKPTVAEKINLKPATKEEKKETDQNKQELIRQQERRSSQPPPAANGKNQVSVVITNAGADMVNAYVSGVFEEGGTCTATFTQGTATVTRTSTGFANVSYTQCAPITPSLPSGGAWSVVVSYNSATAEGNSQAQAF